MSSFWRRLLFVLGLFVLAGGCNPLLLPFYLVAPEPKLAAEYHKLTGSDKKETRVAILTYMGLETRSELIQADRDIARGLALHLQKLAKDNGEKVTVINPLKVEEYRNNNPDWNSSHLDLETIGKHLGADYVVYIEIGKLSMYQPRSAGSFYRGQADLTVSLVDVHNPDEIHLPRQIAFTYPPESQGGNLIIDSDTPPQKFKMDFLNALCRKLSWQFAERPTRDSYMDGSK